MGREESEPIASKTGRDGNTGAVVSVNICMWFTRLVRVSSLAFDLAQSVAVVERLTAKALMVKSGVTTAASLNAL